MYKFVVDDIVSLTNDAILDLVTLNNSQFNRKYGINLAQWMINVGRKIKAGEISNTLKIVQARTYDGNKIYRVDLDGCDAYYYHENSLRFQKMNIFDEDFLI